MDTENANACWHIEPHVKGDLSWNQDGTVLTFTPVSQLPADTGYTISFDCALLDANKGALPLNAARPAANN